MLDFRIKTFLTVCHYMNFTRAAEELSLTQPAVSGHIKHLEEYYGTDLFKRDKKHLALTEEGNILYLYLKSMSNDETKIKNLIGNSNKNKKSISLGLTRTIGEFTIFNRLIDFIAKEKERDFYIYYKNTTDILEDLDNGNIDFAFVEGFLRGQNYYVEKFKNEDYICVANKKHDFKNKIHRLKDLLDERIIVREEGSGTLAFLQNLLNMQNLSVNDFKNIIQVNNMHAIVELLKSNSGISFLFESAVKDLLEDGTIIKVELEDFKVSHDFSFICNKNSIFIDEYLGIFKKFLL
ncbi:LysR family transcriptional regulator [Peptoniphilus sp. MSJ-1]|uniref:LysR family transcriptional regulator n=1 Tax=Peptoniphilus ovalis TaxID=2841503 RepID=A0ABS6FHZ1_9FIRM|nr:LysR family transcriptional regulator [Peptoniphilus ovalis]MBU5668850.1 LysR family transcriptional regulator [Peptoniphilus ovalis]